MRVYRKSSGFLAKAEALGGSNPNAARLFPDYEPAEAALEDLPIRCQPWGDPIGEALRHKYIDESECSPRWLAEAKEAVTQESE